MAIEQLTLDGGSEQVSADCGLDLDDKVEVLMQRYPATRGNDVLLALLFWIEFDGWREVMGAETCQKLINHSQFLAKPETLSRARRRRQRLRKQQGSYRPRMEVQESRKLRDGAGPAKQRKW